jgi:hypothetical protein
MSRSTTCHPHSICRCYLPLGDGVANFFPMTGGAVPSFILKIRSDRSEKLDCGGYLFTDGLSWKSSLSSCTV